MESSTSAPVQRRLSPFLRIPIEIRKQIYSYLLTADPVFEFKEKGNKYDVFEGIVDFDFNDVYSFHINRQIWSEAWDHLLRSNVWIQATSNGPSFKQHIQESDDAWCLKLQFPCRHVPLEYQRRLAGEVAINIQMNKATQPDETLVIAYHPLAYGEFVQNLYWANILYQTLDIQLNPSAVDDCYKFGRLVQPLTIARGFHRADFSGVEVQKHSALQAVSQAMIRLHPDPDDVEDCIEAKQLYLAQGRIAEQHGNFSEAMCQFWLGIARTYIPQEVHNLASPKCNTLMELDTDLNIGLSRSAHKHVFGVKKRAPGCDIDASHIEFVMERGMRAAVDALGDFVGLTDHQRCEGHLYLALNTLHYADDVSALIDSKHASTKLTGRPEPGSDEDDILKWENNVSSWYLDAARDIYFASQLDPWNTILLGLDQDDRATIEKMQKRPGPQAFELGEAEVPLLGEWKGDPRLWDRWDDGHRVLMKQFRLRYNVGPDGEPGQPEDLVVRYAAKGVTWRNVSNMKISVTVQ
ncbi:CDP-alcohol phosphatidyltransferase class-I family [Apiospora arundinis]